MDQHIGFCSVPGGRIAYAVTGDGPPLVLPAWWMSHVEIDWQRGGVRQFIEALSAHNTVIRYDRLGTGLSDRERPPDQFTLEAEVRAVEAIFDELEIERAAVFAISCAGVIGARFAAEHPERVSALAFYGAYADGTCVAPNEVERLIIAAVRTHWGMGSRLLTDLFYAGAPEAERTAFERFQRATATPEMAAELLEFVYATEAREAFGQLRAPTLVMHRREDRAVPFELGREAAALVPGARFVPLEGETHVPWSGQSGAVAELVLRFLGAPHEAAPPARDGVLSDRELDVLRLVAVGLSDTQIAEALVLSPHTVHRHVANIRAKLRQPTRGAATAEAARRGLI